MENGRTTRQRLGIPRLCIVVPVYHNAESLPILHDRLVALEQRTHVDVQVIYVEDRSRDHSFEVLRSIAERDDRARVIRLSRNFGSFTAIRAGLAAAHEADCVAVISADLQDPPEHLEKMLLAWREGYDVVLAVRRSRDDGWLNQLFSSVYYWLLRRLALPQMPAGGFDFLLIDHRVASLLCQFGERNTSLMGLVLWLGFEKKLLPYDRQARPYGRSMWSLARKLNYFIDSFAAFTAVPLRFASGLGIGVSAISFLWCVFVVLQALLLGRPFPGWSSLMAAICFLGGVQLLSLGIIGEYLWRNLEESRRRPLYIVDEILNPPALRSKTPRESALK